jgi:hypothetical protein
MTILVLVLVNEYMETAKHTTRTRSESTPPAGTEGCRSPLLPPPSPNACPSSSLRMPAAFALSAEPRHVVQSPWGCLLCTWLSWYQDLHGPEQAARRAWPTDAWCSCLLYSSCSELLLCLRDWLITVHGAELLMHCSRLIRMVLNKDGLLGWFLWKQSDDFFSLWTNSSYLSCVALMISGYLIKQFPLYFVMNFYIMLNGWWELYIPEAIADLTFHCLMFLNFFPVF